MKIWTQINKKRRPIQLSLQGNSAGGVWGDRTDRSIGFLENMWTDCFGAPTETGIYLSWKLREVHDILKSCTRVSQVRSWFHQRVTNQIYVGRLATLCIRKPGWSSMGREELHDCGGKNGIERLKFRTLPGNCRRWVFGESTHAQPSHRIHQSCVVLLLRGVWNQFHRGASSFHVCSNLVIVQTRTDGLRRKMYAQTNRLQSFCLRFVIFRFL